MSRLTSTCPSPTSSNASVPPSTTGSPAGAGVDRGHIAQERLRSRRTRSPEIGAQGLPQGPPSHRAAQPKGHRHVQILAGRGRLGTRKAKDRVVVCLDDARALNAWL